MKSYYRIMLGKASVHAAECFEGGFIGTDFDVRQDLTNDLPEDWRLFNRKFIPLWQAVNPGKSKIAAGLSCGFLWTVSKGILVGDIVLCPDGSNRYRVGEVIGGYHYVPDGVLFHRRAVRWLTAIIDRSDMSLELRRSAGSIGTVSNISAYRDEIEGLLKGVVKSTSGEAADVLDPSAFALEKHLEDFLVKNWSHTELAKEFDLYTDEEGASGQQFPTDTGPLDILAVSKDKKQLLVIELKKGRASDDVVGQILRYMGYVKEVLAEPGQTVRGLIIALEDDLRIRRALAVVETIGFYRYQISFKLVKG